MSATEGTQSTHERKKLIAAIALAGECARVRCAAIA